MFAGDTLAGHPQLDQLTGLAVFASSDGIGANKAAGLAELGDPAQPRLKGGGGVCEFVAI